MLICCGLVASVLLAASAASQPAAAPPAASSPATQAQTRPAGQIDRVQPVCFDGQPSGVLQAGTRQVTIRLRSNEESRIRLATWPQEYDLMPYDMSTKDGLLHEFTVGGLQDGTVYRFYARAMDSQGNISSWSGEYQIGFAVRDAKTPGPSSPFKQEFSIEQAELRPPVTLSTDEAAGVAYAAVDPRSAERRSEDGRRRGDLGDISFSFVAPAVNEYILWARVFLPDKGSDTFVVSIDGRDSDTFDAAWQQSHGKWVWQAVNGRDRRETTQRSPRIFVLGKGPHTMVFSGVSAGARLAKVIITDDLSFQPKD